MTNQHTSRPAPPSKVSVSRVTVETHAFRFAHGVSPRGRGSWAFAFVPNASSSQEVVFFDGFFAAAAKQARAWAASQGRFSVFVQS